MESATTALSTPPRMTRSIELFKQTFFTIKRSGLDIFWRYICLSLVWFLMSHSRPLFLNFVFSKVNSQYVHFKVLPMTGYKPRTSSNWRHLFCQLSHNHGPILLWFVIFSFDFLLFWTAQLLNCNFRFTHFILESDKDAKGDKGPSDLFKLRYLLIHFPLQQTETQKAGPFEKYLEIIFLCYNWTTFSVWLKTFCRKKSN